MSCLPKGNPFLVRMDRTKRGRLSLLILTFCLLAPTSCYSQFNPVFPNVPVPGNDPNRSHLERLPEDSLALISLNRARAAISDGNITDGLEAFQSLLDESSDFFQKINGRLGGSLHQTIEQTIAEHRDDYERLYGAEAEKLLIEALSNKDQDLLTLLVRRFRMTNAGQKATRLSGVLQADTGDIEAAIRSLLTIPGIADSNDTLQEQARQADQLLGLTGSEADLADYLAAFTPQAKVDLGQFQQRIPPAAFNQSGEAELYDWINPHGGTAQAGQSVFAPAMFSDAWTQPLIDQYDFFLGNAALEKARLKDAVTMATAMESRIWSQTGRSAFPAGRPLIVDDRVIVPGYASIKAFDINTGELDGVGVNIDQSFEYLNESTATPSLMDDSFREEVRKLFFTLRGWRDLTSASLSTDGKYVYTVSDCQLVGSVAPEYLTRSTQRHELLPQTFNQLHAFDLNAGLRNRWSIGTVDEHAYLPFEPGQGLPREIFFYGAPLPVEDHLFVIGEERGQILLYELDQETGSVIWSLSLLNPKQDIVRDDARRMAGLVPTYANGLLICPTGEGVITAVDPWSRKVVWSHQYEKTRQLVINRLMFRRGIPNREQTVSQSMKTFLADDRWFDAKVVPAGKYVVHTPPDSDEFICLNTLDGTPAWDDEVFRLRSLYVGAVFHKSLIVVGTSEISAVNLEDAVRLWNCPIPPPSGRGVRMGDHFAQPLMTGDILFIDLKTGRQLARSPMPGQRVIGNLVAAHGRLFAQSGTEIVAFKSASEINQMLVENKNKAESAAIQAELSLQQGDRERGLQKFESIAANDLSPRGRSVLAWAKLDSLQHDFENTSRDSKQIEQLLTTDQQRFVFLKAMTSGLHETGDLHGAFRNYLALFENLNGRATLRDINGLHELNDQSWALSELTKLFEASDEKTRPLYENEIKNWLTGANPERAVVTFLKSFPLHYLPGADVLARLKNIEARKENASALNTIYEKLRGSNDPAIASAANRDLALLALDFKDGLAADSYLKQFQGSKVPPLGSTASPREVASTIRTDQTWSEEMNSFPVWPNHVTESDKTIPFAKSSRSQIPVFGPTSVPLKGWTFFLNPMGSQIDVYDQHGRRQCQLSTGVISTRLPIGSSLGRYVSVRGHLALIVLADRFLLVDFQQRKDLPRVVANELLITEDQNPYGTDTFVSQDQSPRVGFRTFTSPTPLGTLAGNVGALGGSSLCYGLGSQLIAIDPDHGHVLWKRHDLPLGSEIFSDDEYVLTMAPGSRHLQVYRAVDGSNVGTTEVPGGAIDSILDRENGDWGRYLPVLETDSESFRFSLYDPVEEKTLWSHEFPSGTVWTTIEGQDLAFLSPNNKLTIATGLTGGEILSKTIPVTSKVQSITVEAYDNQWIVLPGTGAPLLFDFSYPSLITRTIEETVTGTIVAIDQISSEITWTHEITDQKITTQSPTEWPILFFGKSEGRVVNGLVLNRMTGEVIVEEQWPFDRSWIHWQATIQPLRILIGYGRKTVTLDCQENLLEATQPETAPPQRESKDED